MRNSGFFFFLLGLMALLDIYIFQALQVILPATGKVRLTIIIAYWTLSAIAFIIFLLIPS